MVTLGRHTRPDVIQRNVDVALSQSDYLLFFHIPFRKFCLKEFFLFKVLPFEWNALSTPFNPWTETVLVCGWSKVSDRGLHRPLQICNIVRLSSSQNLLQCGEQVEITGGQIRAVRRLTKHFDGPSVDHFLSRRSPMARRIVMMKQHGRQQGRSKEVSVQYLLVRNANHRKRSTKHVIDCFHIIINSYLEMLNVI